MAIVLMILGFIWWWPLGLLILAALIASGRIGWRRPVFAGGGPMGCWSHDEHVNRWEDKLGRMQEKMDRVRTKMEERRGSFWGAPPTSGNRAFDDYRRETLRRLEDEQREFKEFLERLRFAKDRDEFDQFMADRRRHGSEAPRPSPRHPRRRRPDRKRASGAYQRRPSGERAGRPFRAWLAGTCG